MTRMSAHSNSAENNAVCIRVITKDIIVQNNRGMSANLAQLRELGAETQYGELRAGSNPHQYLIFLYHE